MASKIIIFRNLPSLTGLTGNVYPETGGAALNASPLTFAESLTPGLYTTTMSDAGAGRTTVNIIQSGSVVGQFLCDLVEAAGYYELFDPQPANFTAAALLAMRNNLTGALVLVRGPVTGTTDGLTITLTIGDDYSNDDSRAIELDLDGTALPDLTGAITDLVCKTSRKNVVIQGTIPVPTGSTRTVRFEPTADQTALLTQTVEGEFWVRLVTPDDPTRTITPVESRGTLIVLPGVTCNEVSA